MSKFKLFIAFAKYPFLAVLLLLVKLLAIILSPILSLWSVIKNINVLPYPFNLLHTHDNDLDGGQDQGYEIGVTGFKLWWQRTCWISRNPAYGFAAEILGFKKEGATLAYESKPVDTITWLKNGDSYFCVMVDEKGRYFFCYRVLWGFKKLGFRTWFGWNNKAYGGVYHQLKATPLKIKMGGFND